MENLRFSRAATNGISLNVAQAGPDDGPLVLLLRVQPQVRLVSGEGAEAGVAL